MTCDKESPHLFSDQRGRHASIERGSCDVKVIGLRFFEFKIALPQQLRSILLDEHLCFKGKAIATGAGKNVSEY